MIYVTLPSKSSIDIYSDNKILRFKVNLPKTLHVKEIQFRHLWYSARKELN